MLPLYYLASIVIAASLLPTTNGHDRAIISADIGNTLQPAIHDTGAIIWPCEAVVGLGVAIILYTIYHFMVIRIHKMRKTLLAILLISVGMSFVICVLSYFGYGFDFGRCISTLGLLSEVSGAVQLTVTEFFEKLIKKFSNTDKWPYGPPSSVTRELIDNPDTPIRTRIKNIIYYREQFGVGLVVIGILVQVVGVWMVP